MKIIHTSDLHIGKRVNEYSMIEDQRYILEQIIALTREHTPDAFLISGDIYDRQNPSAEAVSLFGDFLTALSSACPNILIISGNHDSEERLAFAGELFHKSGIYISPVFDGKLNTVTLYDEYGKINFVLAPFIKPAVVRHFFPNEEFTEYNDALKFLLDSVNYNDRTVLLAHQFVTGAARSDSEEAASVGGAEEVSRELFSRFDYTALGHIHRPQSLGRNIRYSGSPLKYSASEANFQKSLTLVTLKQKGELEINELPLIPMRDMRIIKGTYADIMDGAHKDEHKNDYVHAVLTDTDEIPNAAARLRNAYPNLMTLHYDNIKNASDAEVFAESVKPSMTPLEYLCELYEKQNNSELKGEKLKLAENMIDEIFYNGEEARK
mgnify:CR=1 FL=1